MFELVSKFQPSGDQPIAIKELVKGIKEGKKEQVLLGATGTGKTFTIANVIKETNKPTLVLAHNKTLAGQLYSELKEGRDASREEVTAKCEEINQLNDELSKLEADLLATRNKKKCASCGVEIDIKAEFCPKCGKEQPKQETVEVQDEPENANEVEATEEHNDNN